MGRRWRRLNDENVNFDSLANKLIHNLVLVIILAWIIVYILNIIIANQIIYRIRREGIDYDAFREMNISGEIIEEVLDLDGRTVRKTRYTNTKASSNYDEYDVLTLYMLVYKYDTLEFEKISQINLDLILRSLVYDESFKQLKAYYYTIFFDIKAFPVLQSEESGLNVGFENTWKAHRSYGGDRVHEGTDLMAKDSISGQLKVLSMTDGVVEQKGWLEQGGYRIGIRSSSGTYFYYAHLDSYPEDLNVGDFVEAGEFIGYMGDTGYGQEVTRGQFDVHLHMGIYIDSKMGEISVNPYYILKYLSDIGFGQGTRSPD